MDELPRRRYEKTELVATEGLLVIRTPYERVRVEAAKKIPLCRFNPDLGGWAAPPSSWREVFHWCLEFDCPIPAAIEALSKHVKPHDEPAPAPVVEFSVYQGIDGPTVTVITPDGAILTKTFGAWVSAARYVTTAQRRYEKDGSVVEFITAPI